MRKIIFILSVVLVFLSCVERVYKRSDCTFQLPEKKVFVKTSKLPGGRFIVYFAQDSLSLENSKDSIEYRTGWCIRMIVDTTYIYVDSSNGTILNIGKNHFNIKLVSDSVFHSFFENNIQKNPYSFISIDAKEYRISVNQQRIKKGDIRGGW